MSRVRRSPATTGRSLRLKAVAGPVDGSAAPPSPAAPATGPDEYPEEACGPGVAGPGAAEKTRPHGVAVALALNCPKAVARGATQGRASKADEIDPKGIPPKADMDARVWKCWDKADCTRVRH